MAGSPNIRVVPVSPPQGAISRSQACRYEREFLYHFAEGLRTQPPRRLYDPKLQRTRRTKQRLTKHDPYRELVHRVTRLGHFDLGLLDSIPHNRWIEVEFGPRRRLWRRSRPFLRVVAIAVSPLDELIQADYSSALAGWERFQEFERHLPRAGGVHTVIGALSTTGWRPEFAEQVPEGEQFHCLLVEPGPRGGWRTHGTLPTEFSEVALWFDPEDSASKISRCAQVLSQDPELLIPGGYRDLEELRNESGVEPAIFEASVRQLLKSDPKLDRIQWRDRELLKRDRY